ncbi:MAG: energy-coupling factor transporter ATPase [Clostridia bacterium]|nr:energy-coupling factor transporter ATPase [Clostridia bacterium]
MSIVVNNLCFTYNPRTEFSVNALIDVNVTINDGEIVGIVGHTGSGKSTFVQHLNGLIKLQSGSIIVNNIDLSAKKIDYNALRSTVGMVFQYPEYQLFADSVGKDIAFGPKNLKLPQDLIDKRVNDSIDMVGLDRSVMDKSPFDLSGGERRRVALAGVLAMQPSILILDEPTAGLDPQGKGEILSLVKQLNKQLGTTIIMVSHDMNEIYENTNRVLLFGEGRIIDDCSTELLFAKGEQIDKLGLQLPTMASIKNKLASRGIYLTGRRVEEVFNSILDLYSRNSRGADNV